MSWLHVLHRYERLLNALYRAEDRHPDVGEFLEEKAWAALDGAINSVIVKYRGRERQRKNRFGRSTGRS